MAQPRDYTRQYNFNDFQTTNPSDPLPGAQVDGELDAVKLTLDDLNANIGKIQRDDGKLKNAAVHKDAFSQDALALVNSDFTPRGDWATATSYAVNDAVDFNGATYVATVAHTSSAAFSTDDAADRWILIANAAISGTGSAVDKFEGDGNTTSFTLTYTYASETAVQVFVNGELLNPVDDYTISGNTLTLYTAPGLPTVPGNENVIVWGASVVAQAAAQDASGHESNASGYADESEAWASQTSGIVESTDYSSKAYAIGGTGVDTIAGSAKDWATKTSGTVGNTGEYSAKYWATQGNVPIVAQNIADINTVAGISANVTTVASNDANVTTVAGVSTDVTTVAGISANVTTVAANDANVTTLAGLNTEITTLGGISTDISTVSGISANTTTVAGISSDVTTAAGISANITTVAGISSNVTTVAQANTSITAIGADLAGTNTIGTTAGSIANVNIVANAITNVNSAAQNMTDINTVAGQINNNNLQTIANDIQAVITTANDLNEATSEIDTVANSIANVDAVGASISNVNTVATNLTSVNAFFDTYFVSATVPTSPTTGDLWFDTSTSSMKVYTGNSFVNAGSAVNGTADRYTYTATANQTTFSGADDNNNTLAYDAGFIDVYMNGVKLMPGDITASNGTSIVLTGGGAAANDTIEIVAYGTFELANININSMTDVSTTGVENGSLLVYNDANSQFETSGDYKTVYTSTTHTATNLTFYTTNGSDIAQLAFTRTGHGLSIGDYVRVDSTSVTSWLTTWNLFDLTSIAQMVQVVDVYNDTFFVNITCNSVQTSSSSLGQNGTYYYDTGVATISAPDIDITTSSLDVSGELNVAKKATANEIDLNAISATIANTAVDIFVYDTSKDSDGGAWRKRTQHTSWYNETLNTGTRGSRREFPAVAVIVAESALGGNVNIYDGDDPDLPLWMTFNNTGVLSWATGSATYLKAVSFLNGVMSVGTNGHGCTFVDFAKDDIRLGYSGSSSYGLNGSRLISNRNSSGIGYISGVDGYNIVNSFIHDIAMAVLPNAPVDDVTGLPAPTIGLATQGGISVIRDDGTVKNSAASNQFNHIAANKDGFAYGYNSYENYVVVSYEATATNSWSPDIINIYYGGSGGMSPLATAHSSTNATDALAAYTQGNNIGLTNYDVKRGGGAYEKLFNYTTSSYNTGWMNGDIKLAALSDTDATNITGSELVADPGFNDSNEWYLVGWTIDTVAGTVTKSGNIFQKFGPQTNPAFTLNKTYIVEFEVTNAGSNGAVSFYYNGSANTHGGTFNGTGVHSTTFTPTNASTYIRLGSDSGGMVMSNFSVRLAELDRSVNGNGLQVFGSITKSAVATGADLVAYSGWSASNYLQQPYNADVDLAAGEELFVCGWVKHTNTSGNQILISMRPPSGTGTNWWQLYSAGTSLEWIINQNNLSYSHNTSVMQTGVWQFLAAKASSSGMQIYYNGELKATRDIVIAGSSDTSSVLKIGVHHDTLYPVQGSMALWRVSKTVPSPEQIKKIYEDEKVLFQEGAQATLYGSSDAVTALAYDDSTDLLHVGTSAGRSVFKGLRRVDNTTTAVGAAISASNGLVADE